MNLPEGNPNHKSDVLSTILAETRRGLVTSHAHRARLEREIAHRDPAPSFQSALAAPGVGVIAEIKRRSPSAGAINPSLDPITLGAAYEQGGAAAISVLTEGPHFGGSLGDLESVSASVGIPTLRKDFIVDRIQLLEARAAGAAAALLIVRALDDPGLRELIAAAREIGLDVLVEAHDAVELARAVDAGAEIIGINARNLDDFSMDAVAALELIATIPQTVLAVAESGMRSRDDVMHAAAHGADAVLIGGALAAAPEPGRLLRSLTGITPRAR